MRKLTFRQDSIAVSDTLKGNFKQGKSRFYFHPDLIINLQDDVLKIEGTKIYFT